MKKMRILKLSLILTLSLINYTLFAIIIDGNAYLENQADNSGIEVFFERTAPSSLTYSVYTNASGFYTADIETGFYDITYSKDSYVSAYLYDQQLYSDTTLDEIILIEYYSIQSEIDSATDGDTILVQPGTYYENINFNGKNIIVASLFFTTQDTSYISQTIINGNDNGTVVTFNSGEDSTAVLTGLTVTNGNAYYGGGIFISNNSNPKLNNLIVKENSVYWNGDDPGYGGGICCSESNPNINNIKIYDNNSFGWGAGQYSYGGGIAIIENSSPILNNFIINENISESGGGGFYCNNSTPILTNIHIINNWASYGGGIYLYNNSNPIFRNVTVQNNSASNTGGVVCSNSSVSNVLISGNSGNYTGGLRCSGNSTISYTTIVNNSASSYGSGITCQEYNGNPTLLNLIVSNNSGNYGLYVYSGNPSISYSNFYNNENGNFYNCGVGVGIDVITNANGDSCDCYYNLQYDPLFLDPENGDYHLTANSPCIDAGDPTSPFDPDGTITDMGAFYFHQGVGVADELVIINQRLTNYPNPFNPTTTISYQIQKSGYVNIAIYNIKGQKIKTLLNKVMKIGKHSVIWNGYDVSGKKVSSGIYLYRLIVDGKSKAVKKCLLLK